MSLITQKFDTNGLSFTCGFLSLAVNALRQSTALDISALANVLDVQIQIVCEASTSPSSISLISAFAYGSIDGTVFPDSISGTDSAYTGAVGNLTQLRGVVINSTGVQYGQVQSLANAFGGFLPAKVGIVIRNDIGNAVSSTAGNNKILYRVIYGEAA